MEKYVAEDMAEAMNQASGLVDEGKPADKDRQITIMRKKKSSKVVKAPFKKEHDEKDPEESTANPNKSKK